MSPAVPTPRRRSGRRRRSATAAALLLTLPVLGAALACGDDAQRPDPIPGLYTLRTVNGAVLPWVTTWPGEDTRGNLIPITDTVHISSIDLKPENHEFARSDSGNWTSPGYQQLTYAYRFSGTYAILPGDTVRFTATSGSYNNEPLFLTGFFPDTSYAVLTNGRLQMVERFYAAEHPPDATGRVGAVTLQSFNKSYGK